MASKRRLRRKQCGDKARHATEEAARVEVLRAAVRGLQPYRCAFCGDWHVGHPPAGVRIGLAAERERMQWDRRLELYVQK